MSVLFSPSLPLPFAQTASPKRRRRRRTTPPRGRLVLAVFRHYRREHRACRRPCCAPVFSALPAPPRRAAAATSVGVVMAPPRLGLRPTPRSTVDPVDPCPTPVHGPPPWTTSPESTRGQASCPPRAAPGILQKSPRFYSISTRGPL